MYSLLLKSQHSCSVAVSFPVEEDTNQGSNPGGSTKKKNAGNLKNSGRSLACGTCGWFGPSYQGVVALVANTVSCGRPRLQCGPIGWTWGSWVFSAGLAEVSSWCNAVGAVFPLPVEFFFIHIKMLRYTCWKKSGENRCLALLYKNEKFGGNRIKPLVM